MKSSFLVYQTYLRVSLNPNHFTCLAILNIEKDILVDEDIYRYRYFSGIILNTFGRTEQRM